MAGPSNDEIRRDIGPVFEAFGAAAFYAQTLESQLTLLLRLAAATNLPHSVRNFALDRDAKTMAPTLEELWKRGILSKANVDDLISAVQKRNFLVHNYWQDKRVLCLNSPAGRAWLIIELVGLRDVFNAACHRVGPTIDHYLQEYGAGVSMERLANDLWNQYEGGVEPPPELLN